MSAIRIGGPIALIVIGLILALAVTESINGIDLVMIGWILAGAGALWLIIDVVVNLTHSSATKTPAQTQDYYRDR